jgi:predicted transcriptional regulator
MKQIPGAALEFRVTVPVNKFVGNFKIDKIRVVDPDPYWESGSRIRIQGQES